jgi:cysteine sulfinate desulfinase/cysteine desulfurase-like protein
LDYNGTTPLDIEVVECTSRALLDSWHNPSSQSSQGKKVKQLINESRRSIAQMVNAQSQSDIVFVSGGTEVYMIQDFFFLIYKPNFYKKLIFTGKQSRFLFDAQALLTNKKISTVNQRSASHYNIEYRARLG